MSLSKYLILMILATFFCWISFYIVITSVDPWTTNSLGFVFFYLTLFVSLVGTISLLSFTVRYFFNKTTFITQQIMRSFRQAILFSTLIIFSLFLQSHRLITWWNLIILAILLVMIESAFLNHKQKLIQNQDNNI